MVASVVATILSTWGQIESVNDNNRIQFLLWVLLSIFLTSLLLWTLLRPKDMFNHVPIIAIGLAIIVISGSLMTIANGTLQSVSNWLAVMSLYNVPFFFGFSYYIAAFREEEK